jgi:mono/diheme cytochrome c family protein
MKHLNTSGFRRGIWAILAVGAFAFGARFAAAQSDGVGDPIAGREIANAWCANCHAFPDSKVATVTGAPSFPAIAANRAITPLSLRAFLQTPHARMPDLNLSNSETDDLIAFVLSSRVH